MVNNKRSVVQHEELIKTLHNRFENNMHRHPGLEWSSVRVKLEASPEKMQMIHEMERTGGEPDVLEHKEAENEYIFYDCSQESPIGRRSICYDREALESRKKNKPKDNVVDMAMTMGIELLTEEQYRKLQAVEKVDQKTSSWIHTPASIRELGGALFCDRRYGTVFVYHNSAESYYAARGFRGLLRV
ncbi:DUF4256 domain-containing protein [Paraliobacillus salinarum]|uniref:DUF4256 domain-containing protein n=1 Tax=Paraliobacillus salinarum TaxID=1158996 RepID=UPI0015F708DC|nr:DUF4256 domain-containing protein [Paraliobacillus salinarum]